MDLARELDPDLDPPTLAQTSVTRCRHDYLIGRVLPAQDYLAELFVALDQAIAISEVAPQDAEAIIAIADSLLCPGRTPVKPSLH